MRHPIPCQDEDHARFALAEPIPGPTHDQLQQAAAQEQVVVISSLFERRAPGLYHNTTVVFDADGQSLGKYRKMHIPDDPHYYEKFYFTPGDLGFRCFATRFGHVGVGICWDQWYPEAARLMALQGAEMLFYPTAIGWLSTEKPQYGESQRSAWETAMRAHAIANGVYVAAVNRVGTEGQIEFWGSSFAADPYGNVIHRAAIEHEELVLVDYQPQPDRHRAHPLAVPARSPYRCLRWVDPAVHRLKRLARKQTTCAARYSIMNTFRDAESSGMPLAGRVGTTCRDVDRLAAPRTDLARTFRTDSAPLRAHD